MTISAKTFDYDQFGARVRTLAVRAHRAISRAGDGEARDLLPVLRAIAELQQELEARDLLAGDLGRWLDRLRGRVEQAGREARPPTPSRPALAAAGPPR